MLDPSILREYDIRGVVGRTLDTAVARMIGLAFGTMAAERGIGTVCVGYDGRLSAPSLESALVDGLVASGRDVVRIGRGPTPMLYFTLFERGIAAGVMVTGSHNPPDHNGFKLLLNRTPLRPDEIRRIGTIAARGNFACGRGVVRDLDVRDAYVARLAAEVRRGHPLKVAWDTGNGAAGEIVHALAARLDGTHLILNGAIDGTFPAHHPDPAVPRNLRQLQKAVVESGCDAGLAFDGDGDRIGLIDETGAILWPDQTLLFLARAVLREHPGAPIIADVKSSQVLFDGIAASGGRPVMAPSGYTCLQRAMREHGAPLAGEMSGHIFFADRYHGVDDALYCAVRILSVLAESGQSLAAFRAGLPKVANTPELRIACPEARRRDIVTEVASRLRRSGAQMNDIDGVRVRREHGWWLLRASNTEAALAARCEAHDPAGLDRLIRELVAQLAASGIDAPELAEARRSHALRGGDQEFSELLAGSLDRA